MNRDPVPAILAVVLLVSVTATAGLCYWYLRSTRELQQIQAQVAQVNSRRALMQSLASEAMEYAKRNPAMVPVLQSLGLRTRIQTNSATTPAK